MTRPPSTDTVPFDSGKVEFITLLFKTVLLRPYVFIFLAVFIFIGTRLLGWKRTGLFLGFTWLTAFICEFSSTRTGIPFGWYFYTGSTVGHELYISNIPFMDSLSFAFLLFASYCMALAFLLPERRAPASHPILPMLVFEPMIRTSWPALALTALFFALIDVVIDPVALRGDRWFLGRIYGYTEPGVHFGVPIANYLGWAVVGLISLTAYFLCDRRLTALGQPTPTEGYGQDADPPGSVLVTQRVLMGCGLYYGVLVFNLAITFMIGETLIGTTGVLMFLPVTALLILRLNGRLSPVAR